MSANGETVFRRPNGFRFVFAEQEERGSDPNPADLSVPEYTIVQNDRHIVSRFYLNDAKDASSLEEATGAAAGVTEGISMLIEPLLSGAGRGLLTDLRRVSTSDDLVVDGVECFVLTTELPPALEGFTRGRELRLAIGKDDYLLRQLVERVFFIGNDAVGEEAVAHEVALRMVKAKLHGWPTLLEAFENSNGGSYTSETTFTLHPQANIEISTREFDDDRLQIRPNPPARITAYEGIGAALIAAKPGGWLIKRVYPGTPAERANLRSSDRILAVDGIDVTDDAEDVVVARIKGPAGTPVSLKLERGHDVLRVDLRRERFTLTD